MKASIIIMVVTYWIIMAIMFSGSLDSPYSNEAYTGNLNITGEVDTSGSPTGNFLTDVLRLLGMTVLGIGLPEDTPSWFAIAFMYWSFLIAILFVIGLIA